MSGIAYWKGRLGTPKEGHYGTFDIDAPYVPDADLCSQAEYEVANPPIPAPTLLERAQKGDRDAIKQLIEQKGGWSALTAVQKEAVVKLMLGYPETI